MEITNFLLLTILVFTPILATLLSQVSLGPNSPIGVVIKHPVDETGKIKLDNFGRPEQGGQWVINIGGSQHNNYSNGIQIPIFVTIFGIACGYIRFLYDRATVHSEHITKTFDQIDKDVKNDDFIDKNYQNLKLPFFLRLKRFVSISLWQLKSKIIKMTDEEENNRKQEINKEDKDCNTQRTSKNSKKTKDISY